MKEKSLFTNYFRQGTCGMLPGGGIGTRKNSKTGAGKRTENGNDRT